MPSPKQKAMPPAVERFIERLGLASQAEGMPRISGRILAYLMIAGTPCGLDELADGLHVSRASVSTNTRSARDARRPRARHPARLARRLLPARRRPVRQAGAGCGAAAASHEGSPRRTRAGRFRRAWPTRRRASPRWKRSTICRSATPRRRSASGMPRAGRRGRLDEVRQSGARGACVHARIGSPECPGPVAARSSWSRSASWRLPPEQSCGAGSGLRRSPPVSRGATAASRRRRSTSRPSVPAG